MRQVAGNASCHRQVAEGNATAGVDVDVDWTWAWRLAARMQGLGGLARDSAQLNIANR